MENIIILDIDGVLINTFPAWKRDELDKDGYSMFNHSCVANLNRLLSSNPMIRIVLSSSRRIGKSIEDLEKIFAFRGIENKIVDKLPDPGTVHLSRNVEISNYIRKHSVRNFIVIDDDDKALLNISKEYADGVILTNYRDGFNEECLEKAYLIMEGWE